MNPQPPPCQAEAARRKEPGSSEIWGPVVGWFPGPVGGWWLKWWVCIESFSAGSPSEPSRAKRQPLPLPMTSS